MGIWSEDNWKFRMEGCYVKLNSRATARLYGDSLGSFYVYSLEYV